MIIVVFKMTIFVSQMTISASKINFMVQIGGPMMKFAGGGGPKFLVTPLDGMMILDKSHINIKFLPKYFLKQCKRAIMVMTIIWALLNEIQSYLHHRKYGH